MKKTNKKSWVYFISAFFLIAGALFLFFKSDTSFEGFSSGGYISDGYFSAGTMTDDLDVRAIRWHKHNGYERLVFDIYEWRGILEEMPYQMSDRVGLYQIGREPTNSKTIDGELSGYRAFSAKLPSMTKSKFIKKMEVYPDDDNSYLFAIHLKKEARYKVFSLRNPARIIIDIQ